MSVSQTSNISESNVLQAWAAWVTSVAFVIYYFSIQIGYSIVIPSIQSDIGITPAQIGVIAAVYTWVYACVQFFSGALLDRLGARKVLLPAVVLVTIGVFLFSGADTFVTFLVAQMVIAVGACVGFVGAGFVGGEWFGAGKFSFMFGLVQFAVSLASAINQNIIAWALEKIDWQTLFGYCGIFGIMIFALALLFLRDPKPFRTQIDSYLIEDVFVSTLRVACIGHIWLVAVIGSLIFGCTLSLGLVWAPRLLQVRHMDPSLIIISTSLIWLGLAAGCLIVPRWSDNTQRRKRPMLYGTILQLSSLIGLLFLPHPGNGVLMLLCFLFGVGAAAHMLAFSSAADVVGPTRIGTASALVNGLMFLVGGALISRPSIRIIDAFSFGLSRDIEGARYVALPLVLGLVMAIILIAALKETYPHRLQHTET